MRWRMEFYHERRGILAHYGVDATRPADALRLGWEAVLAEHPSPPPRRRLPLVDRAQRADGRHASGWVLYRILNTMEA